MIANDSIARCCVFGGIAAALLALAACTSEEEAEKACYDRMAADFESARVFGREQSAAAPFGSREAVMWSDYALQAAQSALSISLIYSDDDRNACDYASDGPELERK